MPNKNEKIGKSHLSRFTILGMSQDHSQSIVALGKQRLWEEAPVSGLMGAPATWLVSDGIAMMV